MGTLPLAPLTDAAAVDLPAVVERIDERLRQELAPAAAEKLRAAMFMLMGLRYSEEETQPLYERLMAMIDLSKSSTFQMVLAEGALTNEKRVLLLQGASASANRTRLPSRPSRQLLVLRNWTP